MASVPGSRWGYRKTKTQWRTLRTQPQKKKQCAQAEKERLASGSFVLGFCTKFSCIFVLGEISMKLCPNYGCVAYGRVVYTQATRCVFCRWDLKPPIMKSESRRDVPAQPEPGGTAPAANSAASPALPHAHKRARLRPMA
jgi:hypothetical protein